MVLLCLLPIPVLLVSCFIGPSELASSKSIFEYFRHLLFNTDAENATNLLTVQSILIDVRLPRIILAFLVGGALSVSGSSLQAIFRNPLGSPYILGLSSGAAFGAALALAWAFLPVQLSAFIFGLVAVA